MNKNFKKTRYMCQAAVIAALYAALTVFVNAFGLANGAVQVRLSEALCILPLFTPSAVWGLGAGCVIANILCGCPLWDIVFGSFATLIGAFFTYKMRNVRHKALCTLPPVISNAVIVPWVLKFVYNIPGSFWYFFVTVGAGELISCTILGMVLYRALYPYKDKEMFL